MEHYYSTLEDNFGVIENLREDDGEIWVECSKIGAVVQACCLGFTPKIGDKVELFTSDDGWILKLRTETTLETVK